jgi:hypothetical protein
MEEKQPICQPTQRDLYQLQIEEYTATNRHGPGDHSFRLIPKMDPSVLDKSKN